MLTSIPVSTAILVVSIVLFVVMCYKGVHTATAALIASAKKSHSLLKFHQNRKWVILHFHVSVLPNPITRRLL